MDPVTIIGLVEGSISLAVQCGSVAKSLNNIAGQYKYAKLTLSTMMQNLDIMQLAWDRIALWSKDHVFTDNDNLKSRLEQFLETGFLVLAALEEDLRSYDAFKVTRHQRSRLVWNESTLQAHQTRIRDQAQSMSLLLQAVQLPTAQDTAELLQQSQKQFIKSDESAFSIVPSRMSSRFSLSTIQTGDRDSIRSSASLEYRQFNFENDLFTARVYKRNYRTSKYQGPRKQNPDGDVEAVDPRKENPQSPELANSSVVDLKLTDRHENVSTGQEYEDFIEACGEGDKDKVSKVLSSYGSTVTPNLYLSRKCDSVHLCPFHATLYGGHLDVMETLFQHAQFEHVRNPVSLLFCEGRPVMFDGHKQRCVPPLHFAAYQRELAMVQLLLRMGAPIHAESDQGAQAIHSAAKTGSIEVLAVLIAAGASVNCRDRKGRQPMHHLSEIERPEVIKYLAEKGAEIDGVSDTSQITPLGLACKNGIDANAKVLLSLGALVTSPILDTAVQIGSPGLLETLLISMADQEEGQSVMAASLCDYNTADLDWTLHLDDESWRRTKLRLLLEYTDLLLKDRNGETVLHGLLEALWKHDVKLLGSKSFEDLFLDILPGFKSREKDEVRAFVRRKREAFSVKQEIPWSDTSAVLENYTSESTMKSVEDKIGAPVMVENSLGWD